MDKKSVYSIGTAGLVWFAALMSSVQLIPGKYLFCSLCIASEKDQDDVAAIDCCNNADQSCEANQEQGKTVYGPMEPCPCPSTCWCHRLVHAQLRCTRTTQSNCDTQFLTSADYATQFETLASDSSKPESSSKSTFSAQQVCVSLCRFLA